MNTEQAFLNGFVKRASQYGYTEHQAVSIFKQAGAADARLAAIQHAPKPGFLGGLFAKKQSAPAIAPAPQPLAPPRNYGMTAAQMNNAQQGIEETGQVPGI